NNGGVGLFGSIGREGRVADLNIREADISGGWNVGGVAGYNGGSLVNVSVVGKVSGVLDNTGGLAGLNGGVIRDCRANVAVEGESAVGGLAGSNNGEITACVATAAACVGEDNAGGIAGMNAGTISDSLASGYVEGVIRAGGIAGLNRGMVNNSAASGAVSGIEALGGLVGDNGGLLRDSLSSACVRGVDIVGGLIGFDSGGKSRSCAFDFQASGLTRGIGSGKADRSVPAEGCSGRETTSAGTPVPGLGGAWEFTKGCYPTPLALAQSRNAGIKAAVGLASVAVKFAKGDTSSKVTKAFKLPLTTKEGEAITWRAVNGALTVGPDGSANARSDRDEIELVASAASNVKILKLTMRKGETYNYRSRIRRIFSRGDGSKASPYEVATPEQLALLSDIVNDGESCRGLFFKLTENIDLGNSDWTPVGSYRSPFNGRFDGGGKTVSNLNIYKSFENAIGLFGYVGESGSVKNLVMAHANVTGGAFVAILVGHNSGTVSNCAVNGSVNGSGFNIGGLAGANHGRITESSANAKVTARRFSVGGLVGVNYGRTADCVSSCDVNGEGDVGGLVGVNIGVLWDGTATGETRGETDVGGLVGVNGDGGDISNSTAGSSVKGGDNVGGLVGSNSSEVSDSAAKGDVFGTERAGGLVGKNYEGAIINCAAGGSVNGNYCVGGLVGINIEGIVKGCASSGYVSGDFRLGGLIGSNIDSVTNSMASGAVTGNRDVGGLVGGNLNPLDRQAGSAMSNSLATGRVKAAGMNSGGLAGASFSPILKCVFDTTGTSRSNAAGLLETPIGKVSAAGLSTSELISMTGPMKELGGGWKFKRNYYPVPSGLINSVNPTVRAISEISATPIYFEPGQSPAKVTGSFKIPLTTADGSPIRWSVAPPDTLKISRSGVVTINSQDNGKDVELTAEAKGARKTFRLTVLLAQ
ncbi:MAG: hypothetical protein LBQ19_02325, partial [Synergistaceae bacterium]|nr:hypothetical protein [Synergistaceae bacterium]